jgi:hypothetical protein
MKKNIQLLFDQIDGRRAKGRPFIFRTQRWKFFSLRGTANARELFNAFVFHGSDTRFQSRIIALKRLLHSPRFIIDFCKAPIDMGHIFADITLEKL